MYAMMSTSALASSSHCRTAREKVARRRRSMPWRSTSKLVVNTLRFVSAVLTLATHARTLEVKVAVRIVVLVLVLLLLPLLLLLRCRCRCFCCYCFRRCCCCCCCCFCCCCCCCCCFLFSWVLGRWGEGGWALLRAACCWGRRGPTSGRQQR